MMRDEEGTKGATTQVEKSIEGISAERIYIKIRHVCGDHRF